ncbi:uncharacterized protein AAEQ78_018794 isoform 2-T2 [Lycaon pictus]
MRSLFRSESRGLHHRARTTADGELPTPRGAGGRWWSWPGEESAVRHPVHSIYPTVAYGEALVALTTAGILADHSGLRSSGNWKEILMMTCSRGSEQTVSSTRVHRGEESQRQQETIRAGAEGHGIQILSNLRDPAFPLRTAGSASRAVLPGHKGIVSTLELPYLGLD